MPSGIYAVGTLTLTLWMPETWAQEVLIPLSFINKFSNNHDVYYSPHHHHILILINFGVQSNSKLNSTFLVYNLDFLMASSFRIHTNQWYPHSFTNLAERFVSPLDLNGCLCQIFSKFLFLLHFLYQLFNIFHPCTILSDSSHSFNRTHFPKIYV